MNKAEQREVQKAKNTATTAPHYAAATLASVMRTATKKTLSELVKVMDDLGLGDHMELINCCYVAMVPATPFIQRIPAAREVLDLELEPKAVAPVEPTPGAFTGREPMVTQEQLRSVDAALAAKKTTSGYRDLSDHFALEQQIERAS